MAIVFASLTVVSLPDLDWYSIGWVGVLGFLTFACLAVKNRYSEIAASGRLPALLANIVVGYFAMGMLGFGVTAALRAHFPIPGGVAWEGGIAIVGGLAAAVIGGCTLVEHAIGVRAHQRTLAQARVTVN